MTPERLAGAGGWGGGAALAATGGGASVAVVAATYRARVGGRGAARGGG